MSEHLKNGEFYAKGSMIFRAPIETKTDTGKSISLGFPVCEISEYVDADNLVECLNSSRHHDALVKALQKLDSFLDFGDEKLETVWTFDSVDGIQEAFSQAREALASIKEAV